MLMILKPAFSGSPLTLGSQGPRCLGHTATSLSPPSISASHSMRIHTTGSVAWETEREEQETRGSGAWTESWLWWLGYRKALPIGVGCVHCVMCRCWQDNGWGEGALGRVKSLYCFAGVLTIWAVS